MNSLKKPLKFLDLTEEKQIQKELKKAFDEVINSGYFILGPKVKEFEKEFAKYLGVKFCIGVGNGLEALQISLMSLGIGKGDEVITTPVSAVATTLAILAVGAKPVFVDTTADGLINTDLIPKAINKKTKAVLPVHLYGNPVDLEKLQTICKKNSLFLIEDAAQAHDSAFKSKKLGTFGNLGCFSFYPTKNLGALGDGGAIVTNNKDLAKVCFQIRDYGQDKKYHHVRYGLNSRLDEIQAALLRVKLKSLNFNNNKRRNLAIRYINNLSKIKQIEIILPKNSGDSNFHLFVIKIKNRNKLINYLDKNGIQTLIHFPALIPDQPFLKSKYGFLNLPVARKFVKKCLSLPLHPKMFLEDVDFICSKIQQFFFV